MRLLLITWNLAAPAAFLLLWASGHWVAGLLVVVGGHGCALIATLYPYCHWWGPQLTKFATDRSEVWLTIDDGPDPRDTPVILEALAECGARATFFVIGEKARRHPDLIDSMLAQGHTVQNHTLTHPHLHFWRLGPNALAREVLDGAEQVRSITGQSPALFRAPAGMKNCFLHPLLRRQSLHLVGWTVRGLDGVDTNPEAIVARIIRGVRPGAIILMHEGNRGKDGRSIAAQCIPRVLAELTRRGYRFIIPDPADLQT
ncbi:MAG: polysaccharide deacetylase family protein [Verrucomicrobiales bacterium]